MKTQMLHSTLYTVCNYIFMG